MRKDRKSMTWVSWARLRRLTGLNVRFGPNPDSCTFGQIVDAVRQSVKGTERSGASIAADGRKQERRSSWS